MEDAGHWPTASGEEARAGAALDVAALTHRGTERADNEDACGLLEDGATAVVAVADGVSGGNAGEVASHMAIDTLLRAYREEPPDRPVGQRLYRAVQQANIEIYDASVVVPELRGMATTLTAAAVDRGELTVVHVGDSRLYLVRGGDIVQLTKDHTVAAERVRLGLLSRERARVHPDRSVLTRSLGRELIVTRDRITYFLAAGDALVTCSDGLYNVLGDEEIAEAVAEHDAAEACRALVERANARGTPDNLTAAVVRVLGAASPTTGARRAGVVARLRGMLRRRR